MIYTHLSSDVLKNLDSVDPELGLQLMDLFLTELPVHMSKIENLKKPETSYEFGKAIHALKGSIAVFGCVQLCSVLKEIELLAKDGQFDHAVTLYQRSQILITELTKEIQIYVNTKAS